MLALGKVLVFVSACGGQGRTCSALGVANALTKRGYSVLLIDGCADGALTSLISNSSSMLYDFGDAARFYNHSPFLGERTEQAASCELSEACYSSVGLVFIPAPADDSGVGAQSIRALLETAAEKFDYCILDCPHRSYHDMAYVCAEADVAVICTTADEQCLSAAAKLRRLLPDADEKCRLLLTRYSVASMKSGRCAGIDAAIDLVGARLLGVVPQCDSLSCVHRDSSFVRATTNVASRLVGERVPLMKLH